MGASVQTPLRLVFIDCVWPVGHAAVRGAGMAAFEDIKPDSRLRGVHPAGYAEIAPSVAVWSRRLEPGVYTERVGGSNPSPPTSKIKDLGE